MCVEFGGVMVPAPSLAVDGDSGNGNPITTGRMNASNDMYESAASEMSNTRANARALGMAIMARPS